jgi:hypothetical protein
MICGVRTAETPTAVECAVVRRRMRRIGMVDIRLRRKGRNPATVAHVRNMMGVRVTIPMTIEVGGSVCV